MLLSRFWYVVHGVCPGATTFVRFSSRPACSIARLRAMGEALSGDSQVVASYLRDDARKRVERAHRPRARRDLRVELSKATGRPKKSPASEREG